MADAGILAWEEKYIHDFWRPVVGIREHDTSMGPTGWGTTPSMTTGSRIGCRWAPPHERDGQELHAALPGLPVRARHLRGRGFHITRRFYGVPPEDREPDTLFKDLDVRVRRTQWRQQGQQGNGTAQTRSQISLMACRR